MLIINKYSYKFEFSSCCSLPSCLRFSCAFFGPVSHGFVPYWNFNLPLKQENLCPHKEKYYSSVRVIVSYAVGGVSITKMYLLFVPLWNECSVYMTRCRRPGIQIWNLLLSPFSASNKLFCVLVFTHSASSVHQCFATHFSGMLFMYSSIMSQEISSSWSVHANPPLSFLGARPVFSQGSFLCESAQPHSLSGCHSPSLHTPNTMALKCENLKTKKASSFFWGMLQDVQVSEDIKERGKNFNNYIIGQSSVQKLCLWWYKAIEGLFTLHSIRSLLCKSGWGYCFQIETHISVNNIIHFVPWIIPVT